MTASLARSDLQRLRDLADSWKRHRRSAWFADGLHLTLDAIEARRAEGGDVLEAVVHADTVPELRDAAVARGRQLWGEKAEPVVERVSTVRVLPHYTGRFSAEVRVRCLNFAEISS